MIKIRHRGDFSRTEKFLNGVSKINFATLLAPYGERGIEALASATPKRSGEAASSWGFEFSATKNQLRLEWTNSKMAGDTPLVILIQYGHGTGTGGYVPPIDFINPVIQPIFDQIAKEVWEEVTKL